MDEWKKFIDKVLNNESEYLIEDQFEKDVKTTTYDLKIIYNNFLNVGFNKKQAFELTKLYMMSTLK